MTTCVPQTYIRGLALCRNLLVHVSLELFVWFIGLAALIGNISVIIQYFNKSKSETKVPHLLVTNLAVSDLCTAIYLIIIGIANFVYHGIYGHVFEEWLRSWMCSIACLLGTAAGMMSVFMMLIISIDRYICIVYPFSTRKLSPLQARCLVLIGWLISIIICIVPVITSINQDGDHRLYYYSSICMPSNVVNFYYRGWLILFTTLTMIAWVITTLLYLFAFIAIRQSSKSVHRSTMNKDNSIAFRLFIIVLSDLVSWLPLYYTIYRVITQRSSNVFELQFVIIIAFPINSALNPYLYTFTDAQLLRRICYHCISCLPLRIRRILVSLFNRIRKTTSAYSSNSATFRRDTSPEVTINTDNCVGLISQGNISRQSPVFPALNHDQYSITVTNEQIEGRSNQEVEFCWKDPDCSQSLAPPKTVQHRF